MPNYRIKLTITQNTKGTDEEDAILSFFEELPELYAAGELDKQLKVKKVAKGDEDEDNEEEEGEDDE